MARPPRPSAESPRASLPDVAGFDQAFADGDFARARLLAKTLLAPSGPASGPERARLQACRRALGLDPYVVCVGLATAAVYAAAWGFALVQH